MNHDSWAKKTAIPCSLHYSKPFQSQNYIPLFPFLNIKSNKQQANIQRMLNKENNYKLNMKMLKKKKKRHFASNKSPASHRLETPPPKNNNSNNNNNNNNITATTTTTIIIMSAKKNCQNFLLKTRVVIEQINNMT